MSRRQPCPDPGNYTWVNTKKGGYWRLNRGTNKEAKLNPALLKNSRFMKICSPISKKLVQQLHPFLQDLNTERLSARLNGTFINSMDKYGKINFNELTGFDFQPSHPLGYILEVPVLVDQNKSSITLTIDLEHHPVKRLNQLVTDYYFEMIMLWGNIAKGLDLKVIESDYYTFGLKRKEKAIMSMKLPKKEPWMVILKLNCLEGDEKAKNPRHYGMKVITAGNA